MGLARTIPEYVSEAEFLALPESNDRLELVDGEVIVLPSPTFRHQDRQGELLFALKTWTRANPPAEVVAAPLDVRFGRDRILQPDLLLVLGGIPADTPTPLRMVPDLVVEILSGNRHYDRFTKRTVYAEAGVREYWIVDLDRRCVEVYRGGEAAVVVTDLLTSELLPGFSLDLATFFTRPRSP